jgi:hypothetical protein
MIIVCGKTELEAEPWKGKGKKRYIEKIEGKER